jgi:hypothetical protein
MKFIILLSIITSTENAFNKSESIEKNRSFDYLKTDNEKIFNNSPTSKIKSKKIAVTPFLNKHKDLTKKDSYKEIGVTQQAITTKTNINAKDPIQQSYQPSSSNSEWNISPEEEEELMEMLSNMSDEDLAELFGFDDDFSMF